MPSCPDAALTLRNIATDQTVGTTVSGRGRRVCLPQPVALPCTRCRRLKPGFQLVSLPDVEVTLGSQVKLDITLPVGAQEQRIEVIGGASVLGTTADAGARDLARDAQSAAAALRHRTARGRDVRDCSCRA